MTETFSRLGEVKPDLVLVAFGAPKQEYFMSELSDAYAPAVALGIGATLDFLAGTIVRSPKWWSDHGLEWLFRLAIEPKRLWRRYLLRDSRIFAIFVRDLRKSRR